MSAHVAREASVEELRDARRMTHRMILAKPDAPGRLILASWCLNIGAELQRRGELAPDCPYCRADIDAAAGKPAVGAALHHERGPLPTPREAALWGTQLVEATP